MRKLLLILALTLITTSFSRAEVVEKVTISGNKRVSNETVKIYGNIKIGKNYSEQDLNKVLNGKANLTTRMAKKLATIPELKTSEQDLVYPSLPLDIAGYFYTGLVVEQYKTSRPQLYVPTPINPNYFGI